MSQALALSAARETKWTVVGGPMKGAVRLMPHASFHIGRSPECEFVIISDPKCSRKHVKVEWTDAGCQVTSLNDNNLLSINGREVPFAVLADGDVLTVGETDIRFNLTTQPGSGHLALVNSSAVPAHQGGSEYHVVTPAKPRSSRSRNKNKKGSNKLFIYLIVIGVVFWLFSGGSKKKSTELSLRNKQNIEAEIEKANKLKEIGDAQGAKRINQSITSAQAQEHYVRGFRDYRRGQFERALDSFQSCLALDPAHVLCTRYARLTQRKFHEVVQYNMINGRKFREQNQYRQCRSSFRNVMAMIKDQNNQLYQEAKANFDACNALVEGRY